MEHPQLQITFIDPHTIDPESTVNVRRRAEANVDRLAEVMRAVGFLPEHPVMVRPHPRAGDGFEFAYEIVAGQCRAAAARAAAIASIPAVVESLADDEALLRSWHENEHRSDLAASEKAQWTKHFFEKHFGDGLSAPEALAAAARDLSVSLATAQQYWWLAGGTEKVKSLIDSGDLKLAPARAIVEGTRMGEDYEGDHDRIDARVDWYQALGKDDRAHALGAIRSQRKDAPLEALDAALAAQREAAERVVPFSIGREQRDALLEYGRARGLTDLQQILGFVVAEVIGKRRAA